jgi:hypothetical protein
VHKLASALGYLAGTFRKEAYDLGPGAGPGSLEVSAPKASGKSLDAGESGHAIASNQPPMTPALQAEKAQSGKANTGLEDNMGKKASANFARLMRMGDEPVETGLPIGFIRKLAAEGPDSSASGEGVPSEPGDVTSQKNMIASNMAAINYTRREAKAGAKRDVNKYLDQPALTAAGDAVLARSLEHTNSAGAKIAGVKVPRQFTVGPTGATKVEEMYAGAKKGLQRYGGLLKGGDREALAATANKAEQALKGNKVGKNKLNLTKGLSAATDAHANENRAVNIARGATAGGALAAGGLYAATRNKESSAGDNAEIAARLLLTGGTLGAAGYMGHQTGKQLADEEPAPGTNRPKWGVGKYIASAIPPIGAYQVGKSIGYGHGRDDKKNKESGRQHEKNSSADFSKVAAARALLSNLIEKVAEEQDGKKKTKEAVVPLNISSPSDSSGFQAQQLK